MSHTNDNRCRDGLRGAVAVCKRRHEAVNEAKITLRHLTKLVGPTEALRIFNEVDGSANQLDAAKAYLLARKVK
jgi:hypothetical protein